MTRTYRVQEFADLAGVTVRTLHHYDRLALLRPKRTESGYRRYSVTDLERLEQIVALKFLGLPLREIKTLLDRDTRDLSEVLRSQRQALEARRRQLDQAIQAIREAEHVVRPGQPTDPAILKKLIEVIEMQDNTEFMNRCYSPEAQAKLEQKRAEWSPELQEQTTKAWSDLFRDVEESLEEDPAGEKAQSLVKQWDELVRSFTGGDAEVSAGLGKVWADRENWPAPMKRQAGPFVNPQVWEFIAKAQNSGPPSS